MVFNGFQWFSVVLPWFFHGFSSFFLGRRGPNGSFSARFQQVGAQLCELQPYGCLGQGLEGVQAQLPLAAGDQEVYDLALPSVFR